MENEKKRNGHWGCPKCGCQSAYQKVERPTTLGVTFKDELEYYGKHGLQRRATWGHIGMGITCPGRDEFLSDYTCPACAHHYKKPKWYGKKVS
jgi:hypothetical protein